jgi:hypothetical protein
LTWIGKRAGGLALAAALAAGGGSLTVAAAPASAAITATACQAAIGTALISAQADAVIVGKSERDPALAANYAAREDTVAALATCSAGGASAAVTVPLETARDSLASAQSNITLGLWPVVSASVANAIGEITQASSAAS